MEDNYFDKKIKGILESPPEFQPDIEAMNNMRARLRSSQGRRRNRNLLPFLMAMLLIPILLGAGFFYKKYNVLSQDMAALQQQLLTLEQRDTIIKKEIIYQIDTVYNIIYQEKYVYAEPPSTPLTNHYTHKGIFQYASPQFFTPLSSNRTITGTYQGLRTHQLSLFAPVPPGFGIFKTDSSISDSKNSKPSIVLGNINQLNLKQSELSPNFNILDRDELMTALLEDLAPIPEARKNPLHQFVPIGFSVGTHASPFVLPVQDYGGTAFLVGLNTSVAFPGNRSLSVGAEFMQMNFELKDPAQFADFPVLDPETPSDVLHELKGRFSYLQIPVMLHQRFSLSKKMKAGFGAGVVAYRPLAQRLSYEYIGNGAEYYLRSTFKNGEFSIDNLRLGLDTEYAFWPKLALRVELQYQHGFNLNTAEYFPLRLWMANIGVSYDL